ncbi:MAG: S24/S26 family peptidase [Candidatus Tectimicrobiota bacterium]
MRAEQLAAVLGVFQRLQRVIEVPVAGASMEETIPDGTRVRVQCQPAQAYEPGAVVVFLDGARIVVHRVIYYGRWGRSKGYLLTQGDNMLWPDVPIPVAAVVGQVIAQQHQGDWQALPGPPTRPCLQQSVARLAGLILSLALRIDLGLARCMAIQVRMVSGGLQRCSSALVRLFT